MEDKYTSLASFQVDVCKQAYNQEDLEDENECEVSCRDVGHNIFILAHQVLLLTQTFLRRRKNMATDRYIYP